MRETIPSNRRRTRRREGIASRPIQLGSVVWAELEDANGYRKVRPVAVVSPTADVDAGKPVRVVAITTRLPDPLPADHVLLPWDRQGKARSGLRRRCAAVANWQAEIAVGDVQEVVGILSPAVIRELLSRVSDTSLTQPEDATGQPADPPAIPSVDPPAAGPVAEDCH
jgi:mRNA-degrading endonuclease toxin of MazEF toxin-antitoxin module